MYAAERARKGHLAAAGDLDTWLQSLDIRVSVESLTPANLERATQLLNKTNQMNMATRRLAQPELQEWATRPGQSAADVPRRRPLRRFRSDGHRRAHLRRRDGADDRLSPQLPRDGSPRRRGHASRRGGAWPARGAASLVADFMPTARNAPCLEFLKRSGLQTPGHRFRWDASRAARAPWRGPPR